ncbi:unnamed protein product [Ectocarpus sp. 12 AP-2014]
MLLRVSAVAPPPWYVWTRPPESDFQPNQPGTLCMIRTTSVGCLVQHRLLSEGVFKGETPEAFHRRRHEKARAKEADKVEKARKYNAKLEAIRAKNAAVISAARNSTSPGALREVVHDTGEAAEAADGTVDEVALVEVAQGLGRTPVSMSRATERGDSVTQGRPADPAGLTVTVSDDDTATAASSSATAGGELTPASYERGGGRDQDGDVRCYEQEFRG